MPLTLTKPLLTTTLAGCVNVNTVNAADDEVDPVAILVPADGLSSARDRGEAARLIRDVRRGGDKGRATALRDVWTAGDLHDGRRDSPGRRRAGRPGRAGINTCRTAMVAI